MVPTTIKFEREVVLSSLVGSQKQGLADQNSDKDYIVFTMPSFEDLYDAKMYSNEIIGVLEDCKIHDIRKLPEFLWKGNLNYIEALDCYCPSNKFEVLYQFIVANLDNLALLNPPNVFKAMRGMAIGKAKGCLKGTSSTKILVEKYGYDTKAAMHAIRILLAGAALAQRRPLSQLARHVNERKLLLAIKNGGCTYNDFMEMFEECLLYFQEEAKSLVEMPPKENLYQALQKHIKKCVRINLLTTGK